jgi:hypothetical protein
MDSESRGPAPGPNETIERHETVVRRDQDVPPAPRGPSNLLWLLPLALIVAGLAWFIFARGEPVNVREQFNVEINAPNVEVPRVTEERRIRVEVPTTGGSEEQAPQPGSDPR